MIPDYGDPTDPRTIALRYADPAYRPEWSPEDRPSWPWTAPRPAFRRWCGDRLPELARLVAEERRIEMGQTLTADHFARLSDTLGSARWAASIAKADAAAHDLTASGPRPTLKEILDGAKSPFPDLYQLTNKLKRMGEDKRRGRTRGEENATNDAREAAAWDIWKLRKIILPRFWPEEAAGEFHLAKLELGKIVAPLHGCTATEAERAYRDGRFADK